MCATAPTDGKNDACATSRLRSSFWPFTTAVCHVARRHRRATVPCDLREFASEHLASVLGDILQNGHAGFGRFSQGKIAGDVGRGDSTEKVLETEGRLELRRPTSMERSARNIEAAARALRHTSPEDWDSKPFVVFAHVSHQTHVHGRGRHQRVCRRTSADDEMKKPNRSELSDRIGFRTDN